MTYSIQSNTNSAAVGTSITGTTLTLSYTVNNDGTAIITVRATDEGGKTVDEIPLEILTGPVTIIDFSYFKKNQPVTKELISEIPLSKKILFKFGWQKFWNNPDFYKNHPYFTEDAANYLVSRKIELIGFDTPSPDDSRLDKNQIDSPIHKILLGAEIILVEYLANLEMISEYKDWNIVVAPLKVEGADGCPARVFLYK